MTLQSYDLVKLAHVIGATVLFGTGIGTAFQMVMAHRGGDTRTIANVSRNVVLADWVFTTPAVILQPITGYLLARWVGYGFGDTWLIVSIGLFLLTGLCWLPVVWIQAQMARLAADAAASGAALPTRYHRLFRIWFILGWPAFAAVLGILHLMVAKPML
jgi:uncharacterized membrane protein